MGETVLSISLLTSNRKKTIRKCLDSLADLRRAVDSELIIVDTGCDREMLDILSEYDPIIVPFSWCNDFSAARNAGLGKARGKWFLYIDDDEWFENTEEIISFFESGEYLRYHSAQYIQRNYETQDGKIYSDCAVSRMFEVRQETVFCHAIHEAPYPVYEPVKYLGSYVHHYGYIYKNEQERMKHAVRNITPLLGEIQKDPSDLRNYAQLIKEYWVTGEYGKSVEVAEDGIRHYLSEKDPRKKWLGILYAGAVCACNFRFKYDEAVRWAKQAETAGLQNIFAVSKLYAEAAKALVHLGDHAGCIEYVEGYLKESKKYLADPVFYTAEQGTIIRDAFEDRVYQCVAGYGVVAAMQLRNTSGALRYAGKILWEDAEFWPGDEWFRLLLEATESPVSALQAELWSMALKQEKIRGLLQHETETARREDEDTYCLLADIWCSCECDDRYAAYMRLIRGTGDGATQDRDLERLFRDSSHIVEDISQWRPWERENADRAADLIAGYGRYRWMEAVNSYMKQADPQDASALEDYLERAVKGNDFYYRYFRAKHLETNLLPREETAGDPFEYEALLEQWRAYTQELLSVYRGFYQEDVFERMADVLPPDGELAFAMQDVLALLDEGNVEKALISLKEAAAILPHMGDAIKKLTSALARYLDEQEEQAKASREELDRLAVMMKEKIRQLSENGYRAEAVAAAEQLLNLVPGDAELKCFLADNV